MIRVFLVEGALNAILETNLGELPCPRHSYMIDDAEIPVQFEVTAGEQAYTIESWVRDNSDARLKSYGEKIELQYNQTISANVEGPAGTQKIFAGVARQLDRYFDNVEFWKNNTAPDPQVGGVLVSYAGEKLSARIVTGAERPDLKCYMAAALLRGEMQLELVRPYKDEFLEAIRNKVCNTSENTTAPETAAEIHAETETATGHKLNFFCDIDTLNYLAGLDYPKDHAVVDLSVDFIEAPFWFIFTDEEESWKLRTIRRGELYSHDEGMGIDLGTLNVSKETNEGSGTTSDQMLSQNMGVFFKAIRNLSYYAQEHGLVDKLGPLDSEESGVMLGTDGKKLTYKIVSGKERPDLMCATLFGGTVMMRPYMDDFWERSEGDFMSLEEKIEAAEGGNEYIMEQLALAYLNGDEDSDEPIEPDPEKAVYWFTKLAELDHSDAQFNLGLHCAKGFGIERSFEKAVYWLKRAEENGDEDAPGLMEKLQKAVEAEKLLSAAEPQSPALAFEEALTFAQQDSFEQLIRTTNIQKLFSTGKPRSQPKSHAKFRAQTPEQAQALADLAAAHMFLAKSMDQAGPGKDFELAFDYARQAAALDNGDGIWALALCYEHGRGVDKEVNKAIELYRRGAELGHAPSQHSLACYYFRGDVLKKDDKTAFELCMKSAQQGYGLAMADVGRCYQFGNGVMGNMKTAVEWYEKSLEVLPDPELERKTAMFKMMSEGNEHWDEDYPGVDEEDFDDIGDDDDSPSGYMAAMEAFIAAEEYETELADQGLLPDAPRPGNGAMTLSARGFPRIALRAEEGDARAQAIMEQMKAANEMD